MTTARTDRSTAQSALREARVECRLAGNVAKRLGDDMACPHPYPQKFGLDTSVGRVRALRRQKAGLRVEHRSTKAARSPSGQLRSGMDSRRMSRRDSVTLAPRFNAGTRRPFWPPVPEGRLKRGGAAKSQAPVSVVPNGTRKGTISRADPALKRWAGITTSLAGRRSASPCGDAELQARRARQDAGTIESAPSERALV